jgi:excinuclease ABC subunit C
MNKKIIDVVYANAQEGLVQKRVSWLNDSSVIQQAVHELQEQLSLPQLPQRMECYDISHIQGSNVVGSMVVFQDGKPRTDQYRRFRIKTVEGVDDYASMQEMLRRRFERLSKARKLDAESPSDSWGIVPDLVLIDGGKGHLSAALEVFLQLGLDDVPLASLAKENEWIYVPDSTEPIVLPRHSQSLYLVQRLRDEAHRFAITYHRNLRSKASLKSSIDMVTGIGPKRKRMLLRRFGTIQAIKEADIDDIAAVPGLTRSLAMRLKETL